MVRIQSGTVARVLSRFRKPKLDLNTHFDVPESLYKRIESYARKEVSLNTGSLRQPPKTGNLSVSRTPGASTAPELLNDLFELSTDHQQKALVGSLLLEHGVSLPVKLDMQYLLSLVEIGMAPQAIRLWKQRTLTSVEERKQWSSFGIELYCRSFRPRMAETLAVKMPATQYMCFLFILAYTQLKQPENAQKWCDKLIGLRPSKERANNILRLLIEARMWDQVQSFLTQMNRLSLPIDSKLTAACFTAAATLPIESSALPRVAALLESDGALVNVPKFRKALNAYNNPEFLVKKFLLENNVDDALNLFENYQQSNLIAIASELLEYAIKLSDFQTSKRILNIIVPKVRDTIKKPDPKAIQFMLTYLQHTNANEMWSYIDDHKLLSRTPSYEGSTLQLSYENYYKLWYIIYRNLVEGAANALPSFPERLDLRELAIITTSKVALRPPLLRLMVRSFDTLPDLPGLISLLIFAQESCNIQLHAKSFFPAHPESFNDENTLHWKDIANLILSEHQEKSMADLSLDGVIEEGIEFRRLLQL